MWGPRLARARPPVAHAVLVVGVPHVALGLLQLGVVDRFVDAAVRRRLGGVVPSAE